ncbi:L-fucose dehydrogenase-like [Mytilus galloprovincialis]|uniref:L-fucose dehydrogenase-like n=1 Tax=Mytilus galloprovincialis TaxID=29158 RepID=UPI003F7B8414
MNYPPSIPSYKMAESCQRYKDKVTLITGGSSGIGKGLLEVFVRHGSKVVFCSNDEKQGKAVEKKINEAGYGGEATFVFADVTKESDVKHLVQETINKYGLLNCVINNAGYHPQYQTIDDITKEDFTKLFDLNVVGYFLISKYALPHLRKTEGNIINIASMDGHHAAGGSTSYVATKGAVLAMTRALAIDEAKYNVRVNSISPGATSSPLLLKMVDISPDPEQQMQRYKDVSVLGRIGQPEEMGMTALYLSADATFCTGIDIQVSGGTPLNYADKNMRKDKTLFI